jgi:hypothetical protein
MAGRVGWLVKERRHLRPFCQFAESAGNHIECPQDGLTMVLTINPICRSICEYKSTKFNPKRECQEASRGIGRGMWKQLGLTPTSDHPGRGPTATATATAFEPSLFVWATVMSRPTEDRAIVDAGLKALAFDSGPPIVCDEPAATYERASDEHGRLAVAAATNRLALGDKIRLIPAHCDPTVNLYNWCVYVRANGVKHGPQRGVVMLVASPYPEAGAP